MQIIYERLRINNKSKSFLFNTQNKKIALINKNKYFQIITQF